MKATGISPKKTSKKTSIDSKALWDKLVKECAMLTSIQISQIIDNALDRIQGKKVKGAALTLLKTKASIYAKILLRRK